MGKFEAATAENEIKIMEVCGTHSEVISKYGIRQLYAHKAKLISGPGCPVCVITPEDIDLVIEYARNDIIIVTFGDLVRVPGTVSSLAMERARGRNIKVVYSPLDSLHIARYNPSKPVVFVGIGFETTAPLVALTIMRAKLYGIRNFSVLCLHRTMPSILRNIFQSNVRIDGLLLPGHVCTITGSKPFEFLAHEFGITGVVSGFTPEDVIQSIDTIVGNLGRTPRIHIQYQRAVTLHGNIAAQKVTKQVFQPCDTSWRGFGLVKDSGLIIKQKWSFFDARNRFGLETVSKQNATKNTEKCCRCGDIMQGLLSPPECQLFKEYCRPDTPLGPCMVSHEGSCSIYYKYGG